MALAESAELSSVRSEIAMARSDLEQVEAAYYPQLESVALVGPTRDAKEPEVVGGRMTDPSPSLSASSIGVFGRLDLTMTQPLYTFGKLSHRREAADRGVRVSEHRLDQKRAEVVLRVRQLYYGLVMARAGMASAKEAAGFFDEAGRTIRRLLELGSPGVRESDLYKVDAYRADVLRSMAEAEKGAEAASYALRSMAGLPIGTALDPADEILRLRDGPLEPLETQLRKARENRPEFKQLEEAAAARESLVKAAVSDRYPSFFAALVVSLAGAPGRDTLDNPYIRDEFNHADAGVLAGLRWSLDFGIGKAKIDRQAAEHAKIRHSLAAAERDILIQVSSLYGKHLEWEAAVKSYGKAAAASRKWVVVALSDFGMGVGTAEEMLQAIEKYGHNQGRYIEALFRYNLSLAELQYATGARAW